MIRAAGYVKHFNEHDFLFLSIYVAEDRTALWRVTTPVFQFPVTLLKVEDQLAFQVLQVADLVLNRGKFRAEQVSHVPTGMPTAVSQLKKLLNFLQRESEPLHLLDKREPCYVIAGIEPELTQGARSFWQQRSTLIKTDRVYTKLGLLCSFADLDRAPGSLETLRHKEIIHSGLCSRVKSVL
jgi:hypothetical protein